MSGTQGSAMARIKNHWSGTKQFDRLLWGGVDESVMSIDNYDALESRLVRTFPPDYLLNRIGGGAVTGLRGLFIAAEMKRRQLIIEPGTGTAEID
jgi:3-dehydroquinate synthetase